MKYKTQLVAAYVGCCLLVLLFLAASAWYYRINGEPTGSEWMFTVTFLAALMATIMIFIFYWKRQ